MSTTKSTIADRVHEATGVTKATAGEVIDSALAVIAASLANGEKVQLAGVGVFTVKETKARVGRNPATGAAIDIPAGKKVSFKPAKELKSRL